MMEVETNGCFREDTMISMKGGGLKRIKDFRKGDSVISFDRSKGKFSSSKVTYAKSLEVSRSIYIELSNGKKITCTP